MQPKSNSSAPALIKTGCLKWTVLLVVAHVSSQMDPMIIVGPFQLGYPGLFQSKRCFSSTMVQCVLVHAQRTLRLEGGSFGASLRRNDEEEHGREEHGPPVAGLPCLPPPCSCAGQGVGVPAPRFGEVG